MNGPAYRHPTPGSPPQDSAVVGVAASELALRRLSSHEDYEQAVELQRTTWGESFRDIVPGAILKVTQRVGGVTAGAFGPDGSLCGFVFGLTGFYDGRIVHWSHMLGVRPELRDLGIGRRLKEYQRELVQEAGVEWIYWTFDPLVARNAHLNLNRLRVQVREYVPDMYGDTGSELHAFGTDRFVVAWAVEEVERVCPGEAVISAVQLAAAPVLNCLQGDVLACALRAERNPLVLIEVPVDVEQLSTAAARSWRDSTRRGFLASIKAGYRVTGFVRERDGRCLYYLKHSLNIGLSR